jgi:murein DD-endopeptidase MepM/ murein hydrolase activator NlpD
MLTEIVPLAAPARRPNGQDAADRAAEAMAEAAAEADAAQKDETAMLETASLEASDVKLAPGPQSLGTLNRRTAAARAAPSAQGLALTTPDHSSVHPVPPAGIEPPMPVDAPVELSASQTAKLADTASAAGSASCRIAANGATALKDGRQSRVVPPQLATQKASLVHQPGVALLVDSACMVESPVNGKVMYAGEFKGYLGVIIVRLASGQQLIAAGLDRIDVKRGDAVSVGQTLGVTSAALAPALAAAYRRDKADKPRSLLYFDMRNSKGDGDKLAWLQAAN